MFDLERARRMYAQANERCTMEERPMKIKTTLFALLCAGALVAPAVAQQDKLGKVTFPTSCDPKVQAQFERGVAMLHSYWFTEARKVFDGVLQQDPSCAIAYWGLAVNYLGNPLAAPPSPKDAAAASDALDKARAIGAKSQRERDWIEAIGAYYRDADKTPVNARLAAYTKAMAQMTERYPDDFEAWTYYALALQASAPKNDKTYATQLKSAEILERLFKQNPDHPGVAHYLVHAYDYPPLADKGIKIASAYAKIAPAAPHARHMPSHIYSMVGMWEDSIASNRSAVEIQPDYYHATDFMVYAHLQLAQDAKAKALVAPIAAMTTPSGAAVPGYTAIAAIPARYVIERGDWAGAAALPVVSTGWPQADSLVRFTRGLGMARTGDVAGARREIQAMQELRAALEKSGQSYWADRTEEQMLAVSGWVAQAEGSRDEALKLMRAAADNEDASVKHVAMENRLYPMRELLGELLIQQGQAAAALRELEASLKENPNRYRALYGAARAAEMTGDRPKAVGYYEKLVALAAKADTARPETARAKTFIGAR
jgi:tetratricopeptide (TPR) repeat protein